MKIISQNKIFFLTTDPTLIGMSRWRGNKQYFKAGLVCYVLKLRRLFLLTLDKIVL